MMSRKKRVSTRESDRVLRIAVLPFNGALSSRSLPNEISLIELGLDGLASHSMHRCQFSICSMDTRGRRTLPPLS